MPFYGVLILNLQVCFSIMVSTLLPADPVLCSHIIKTLPIDTPILSWYTLSVGCSITFLCHTLRLARLCRDRREFRFLISKSLTLSSIGALRAVRSTLLPGTQYLVLYSLRK